MVRDVILCFVGLIVSPLITGVVSSIVRLAPEPQFVVEHGSLDLSCFLTENTNTRNLSRFYVDGKGPVHVFLQNGNCDVVDFMNITYNHRCESRNHFTITLGNVSRLLHGKTCRCSLFPSGLEVASNDVAINVSVPVGGVEIINVSQTIVPMAANHWKTFECKTLPARPVATVKWTIEDTIISSYNTTTEQASDDLKMVTSVLSLFPDKTMNGKTLTCSANNYMDIRHLDWVILNVTYPPDRPVTIEGLQNGHIVSIIENKRVSLNCTIGESNPPVNLTWSCTEVTVLHVSDWNYTTKLLQIQASRNKKPVCSCTSTYPADDPAKSEVSFDVLYPVTISKLFSGGFNISQQQLNVIENDTVHVRCEAEGNPTPTFRWTLQNEHYSYSQNITLDHVKRNTETSRYSCIASNVMNDSTGSSYHGNDTRDFTLIVLYPPRIHAMHNVSIIEGNSTFVNCTINPGNPREPTDVRWIHVPGKQSVLYFNKVNRTDTGLYTCVANNTMNTSYGDIRFGIDNQSFDLQVLYPPEEMTIGSTIAPNHKVIDNISLIENTSLELICSAKGNPMPSFYSWSGFATSDSHRVYLHTSKTNGGNITCLAKNVMTELPQNITFDGTITKTLHVDVLYATNDKQNSPPGDGNAGQVAGGVIGGLLGIGAVVVAVFLVRRRLNGKQLNAANNSCDVSLSQVCQDELKGSDCTVTADGDNSHVYEKLQNAGSDRQYQQLTSIAFKKNEDGKYTETSDGGITNIYEKLQNAGSDKQYEQLKTVDLMDTNGQRIVYENLRIQRDTGWRNVVDGIQQT